MELATMKTACVFEWDEPEGCATPRGWVHLANHPDKPDTNYQSDCCGNYLDYMTPSYDREAGRTVHACAYAFRYSWDGRRSNIRLGSRWCATIEEAKAWIESQVAAYFGRE